MTPPPQSIARVDADKFCPWDKINSKKWKSILAQFDKEMACARQDMVYGSSVVVRPSISVVQRKIVTGQAPHNIVKAPFIVGSNCHNPIKSYRWSQRRRPGTLLEEM